MMMFHPLRPARAAFLPILVCLCSALAEPVAAAERQPVRRAVSGMPAVESEARVIVKFKADSSMMRALAQSPNGARPLQANILSSRLGVSMRDGRALGQHTQVLRASGISSRELAARLSAQPDVEYAEVDQRMRALAAPNDSLYLTASTPAVGQWYLRSSGAFASAINAEAAWAITTGSSGVVVAVLDTGVRFDHPDLAFKLLAGYDFIGGNGTAGAILTANDGDARDPDPSDPGDWVDSADVGANGCAAADVGSSSWHGTETAGLVGAATNNGFGIASIGRDIKVLPLRVLGKCGGFSSDIQAAMLWAAQIRVPGVPDNPNKARVINLSLGSTGACSPDYQTTVNQVIAAGVVVVVAAGNESLAVDQPANCIGVIAVAGVNHTGTKADYSNLGAGVALSAPSGDCDSEFVACSHSLITTTNTGSKGPATNTYTTGTNRVTLGTSFSAPLVSGTAALMLSANPNLTPAQVLAFLKSSARAFPVNGIAGVTACSASVTSAQGECFCTTGTCGAGMLDAGAAVAAVAVVTANISLASNAVVAGNPVTLDASSSRASGTASITNYLWAITSGAATFTSATSASTATLTTSAAGSVVVSLTVTDSTGRQASTSTTLTVSAAPVTPVTPTPTPSSGGGGGGALNLEWLLTLVASTLALHLASRRQRRAARVR